MKYTHWCHNRSLIVNSDGVLETPTPSFFHWFWSGTAKDQWRIIYEVFFPSRASLVKITSGSLFDMSNNYMLTFTHICTCAASQLSEHYNYTTIYVYYLHVSEANKWHNNNHYRREYSDDSAHTNEDSADYSVGLTEHQPWTTARLADTTDWIKKEVFLADQSSSCAIAVTVAVTKVQTHWNLYRIVRVE